MRCRVGDLAVIVSPDDVDGAWLVGRLVRCKSLYFDEGWPCWTLEEPLMSQWDEPYRGVADCVLRPIRDPGDDARDEMLRPLPQEVTA